MSRQWIVAWAGRHRRDAWEDLVDTYRRRIRRAVELREVVVRARGGDGPDRLAREAEALRAALPEPCRWVVLDRAGRSLSSEAFSTELTRWRDEWPHPIAFVIGSDLGLDAELSRGAYLRLSLGSMTWPHEMARLLLYEQLFRALAIESGSGYHRSAT